MSPKIVNASFAALYDQGDVLEQFTKTIKLRKDAQDSPAMRRRIKGILMSGKQFSLDSRLDLFHGIETSPTQKSGTNNLPVVEDSGEPDEKGSSSSENENTSGSHTPHQQDTLEVASPIRHNRSKSVDHQMNLTINDLKVEKEVCNRCGHKVEKVEKLESV